MTNVNNEIIIEKIRENFTNDLELAIIDTFENEDDIVSYLLDVSRHGCVSGIVSELIYYNQTNEFHDKHEDDINNLIQDTIDSSSLSFSDIASSINVWEIQQLKNWKVWFSYEEVVNYIIYFLEDENLM